MSVTLEYPYTSPTTTLVLRNPELGNSITNEIKTQFKISMANTVSSYKKTPVTVQLLLTMAQPKLILHQ